MSTQMTGWICCQIGAREHYAIPRALAESGQLTHLITDAWISPRSLLNRFPKGLLGGLVERWHSDLAESSIFAFNGELVRMESYWRIKKMSGNDINIARNRWFQRQAIKVLNGMEFQQKDRPTLFSYSYAAIELLRYAKARGWRTILGQIDPGPVDETLIVEEHRKHANYKASWQVKPESYWESWREECSLSDRIVVNSAWSYEALQKADVDGRKIDIIPLAYQAPQSARSFIRSYPGMFNSQRPLRVLFLGQISLRKGIAALLEAGDILRDQPIEFWLVGSQQISVPVSSPKNIIWRGAVPRSETNKYYQDSDVFLFPTLSDGFGLTQLEAQAWKLPIIASKFCGSVVTDKINGFILDQVSGKDIADTLRLCIDNPELLQEMSQRAVDDGEYGLNQLRHNLLSLPRLVES